MRAELRASHSPVRDERRVLRTRQAWQMGNDASRATTGTGPAVPSVTGSAARRVTLPRWEVKSALRPSGTTTCSVQMLQLGPRSGFKFNTLAVTASGAELTGIAQWQSRRCSANVSGIAESRNSEPAGAESHWQAAAQPEPQALKLPLAA